VLNADELALCDNNCEEYAITFEGSNFAEPGNYQVRAKFYDSTGALAAIGTEVVVVNTFMVVPESQIGIIALVTSSLAGLGGFIVLRRKHGNSHLRSPNDLGI